MTMHDDTGKERERAGLWFTPASGHLSVSPSLGSRPDQMSGPLTRFLVCTHKKFTTGAR